MIWLEISVCIFFFVSILTIIMSSNRRMIFIIAKSNRVLSLIAVVVSFLSIASILFIPPITINEGESRTYEITNFQKIITNYDDH